MSTASDARSGGSSASGARMREIAAARLASARAMRALADHQAGVLAAVDAAARGEMAQVEAEELLLAHLSARLLHLLLHLMLHQDVLPDGEDDAHVAALRAAPHALQPVGTAACRCVNPKPQPKPSSVAAPPRCRVRCRGARAAWLRLEATWWRVRERLEMPLQHLSFHRRLAQLRLSAALFVRF